MVWFLKVVSGIARFDDLFWHTQNDKCLIRAVSKL